MSSLRTLLAQPPIVAAPGCYDGLSALMIERAGFPAAYFSGASLAYTRFGRPDIGLIAVDEVVDAVSAIRERVALPLIVDCDTGFGNALNVMRTVKTMARAGASAIQLEDQTSPKRCGHLADKSLIGAREMVGKLKAALDARPNEDVLIIARTDAIAVEGFDAALDRAEAYAQAGADLLFIEAPRNDEELAAVARRFAGRVPVMANMVEGGKTPLKDAATLQTLGFSLVTFPGGTVRALTHALSDYFASLRQHGTTAQFRNRMLDFAALNELIGTPEMLEIGRRYDPERVAREK
jgi:2-methylisocitrate lyase-like PEP mutase family enzyme